ncbi:MAG TPA: hypothetical protein DIW15_00300 [Bavariicoccus seileri]|uniref:Tail spike domain-containing protein n=1 Tax=Bavariicoccus seileri TaxID=549685 RepID=A0A3D4S2S2_9ENTE|nr:phage tail spike protein [Bavariicoccus seileri]HCS93135.1 hypothetical protein [Bavariicoccus seileri]
MTNFYLTDRKFNLISVIATTNDTPIYFEDVQDVQSIEEAARSFTGTITIDENKRTIENWNKADEMSKVGNYILYKDRQNQSVFITIESQEIDPVGCTIDIAGHDAGIDLINEVVAEDKPDKQYTIAEYINKYTWDSGWEIGRNEASNLSRKLTGWESDDTALGRILSVAKGFDVELDFSFDVNGLDVVHRYINIYRKRGTDDNVTLYVNKEIEKIVTTTDIYDLCTSIKAIGGEDEKTKKNVTLRGYKWTDSDGRFTLNADGILRDTQSVQLWSRLLSNENPNPLHHHIQRYVKYESKSQAQILKSALSDLKKRCEPAVNYKVEIVHFPALVKIGDTIKLVDEQRTLYLSARVLELKYDYAIENAEATLGDYLIQEGRISSDLQDLANTLKDKVANMQKDVDLKAEYLAQATAPEKTINVIWIDTSNSEGTGVDIPRIYDPETENWVKIVPTQPSEVHAFSKIDGDKIAIDVEQIKEDAKQLSENVEQATEEANERYKEVTQLKTDVDTVSHTVDEQGNSITSLVTKVNDNGQDITQLKQDSTGFKQTVANLKDDVEGTTGKITQLEQNVDGFKSTVQSTYATKDALETQTDKITQATQDLSGFKQTVSEKYATKNALGEVDSKVSSAEQDLSGFKTTVANTYATKTTVNSVQQDADKAQQDVDDLGVSLDTQTQKLSQLSQTVDGFKQTVSETNEKIISLTPSTRNLLLNSQTLLSEDSTSPITGSNVYGWDNGGNLLLGTSSELKTYTMPSYYFGKSRINLSPLGIKAGDTLTYSVYLVVPSNATSGVQARIQLRSTSEFEPRQSQFGNAIAAGTEGWSTVTWTIPSGWDYSVEACYTRYENPTSSSFNFQAKCDKLEVNSTATPYVNESSGRNLIPNTSFIDDKVPPRGSVGNPNSVFVTEDGYRCQYWKNTDNVYDLGWYIRKSNFLVIPKVGDKFTVSFVAKGKGSMRAVFMENADITKGDNGSLSSTWKKFVIQGTHSATTGALIFYLTNEVSGSEIYLRNIKVEEGIIDNPVYSPAPEDFTPSQNPIFLSPQIEGTRNFIRAQRDSDGFSGDVYSGWIPEGVGENLLQNSDPESISGAINGWSRAGTSIVTTKHSNYYGGQKECFLIRTTNTAELTSDNTTRFDIKPNTTYTVSFMGLAGGNVSSMDIQWLSRASGSTADFDNARAVISNKRLTTGTADRYSVTFKTNSTDTSCIIRFDNNGSTDGKEAWLLFGEVKVEEGSQATPYYPNSSEYALDHTQMALANTIGEGYLTDSIVNKGSIAVHFKARASQEVDFSMMQWVVYSDQERLLLKPESIHVTKDWQQFTLYYPNLGKSVDLLRFSPHQLLTQGIRLNDFYLDLCEWYVGAGNKATPWVAASEDAFNQIEDAKDSLNNNINNVREELTSSIEQTSSEILSTVSESYITSSDYGDFVEQTSTALKQTSEDFTFSFKDLTGQLNDLDGNTSEQFDVIRKYIQFIDGRIDIGQSDSTTKLSITNDKISMIQGGSEVMYITDQLLYIDKGVFVSSLQVSEHIWTQLSPDQPDVLSLEWMGDN